MQVTDYRSIRWLEGRVITHGEEENSGRAYMLLEGTDARVHFIYHSREIAGAWQRGRLRPNSFVRLRRLSGDQALSVSDLGDADHILSRKEHFLRAAARLCRDGDAGYRGATSGWLGGYYRRLEMASASTASHPRDIGRPRQKDAPVKQRPR